MSLVNDMLRDLENRKASEEQSAPASGVSRESMIEPQQRRFAVKDISLLVMLVLIASLVSYILLKDDSGTVEINDVPLADISQQENERHDVSIDQDEESLPSETLSAPAKISSAQSIIENKNESEQRKTEINKPVVKSVKAEQAKSPARHSKLAKEALARSSEEKSIAPAKQTVVAKKTSVVKQAEPKKAMTDTAQPKNANASSVQLTEGVKVAETGKADEQAKSPALKVVLSPSALDLKTASDAISLFEVGKPVEAYQLMQDFVASHKTIERTLSVLANRLLHDQRFEELDQLFERAGEPLEPGLRQVKARWLLIEGQADMAIALLEQVQPNIETVPEYYALLASLYQRNNQAGKAFETYSQLIQSNETVADWWAGLGIAADQLSQARQALFAYQQAMTLPGLNRALEQYIRQRSNALSTQK